MIQAANIRRSRSGWCYVAIGLGTFVISGAVVGIIIYFVLSRDDPNGGNECSSSEKKLINQYCNDETICNLPDKGVNASLECKLIWSDGGGARLIKLQGVGLDEFLTIYSSFGVMSSAYYCRHTANMNVTCGCIEGWRNKSICSHNDSDPTCYGRGESYNLEISAAYQVEISKIGGLYVLNSSNYVTNCITISHVDLDCAEHSRCLGEVISNDTYCDLGWC